jgi:mono/diheme cytochrome c family protein
MAKKSSILNLAVWFAGFAVVLPLAAESYSEDIPAAVKTLFAKNCAGCHQGKNPPRGLSWEPERILAAVDRASQETPSLKIIDTADPGASYLLKKVLREKGIAGRPMPPGRPLTKEETATLTSWLESLKKSPGL